MAHRLQGGGSGSTSHRAERADQAVVGREPLPGHLAGVHDVLQVPKYRVGEPVTAQIVPNPLDRVELGAVRRQRQQGDIAGHHEPLASVPAGSVEDYQGMGKAYPRESGGGNLAADLDQVVVHRRRVADRHQCCRLARRRADRAKQIGRGEAEILRRNWPAAALPPHPGQAVLLADPSLVGKPYLDSRAACLRRLDWL